MHPQANWLVADRYFVGDVVGRGGYGMVCRGVDRKTGKQVALKMLSPDAGRDPDVVERMLREQQALVALTGTCAVTAIDLCRLESGAPCLVMEWLEGRDLEQQLSDWEAASERGSHQELLTLLTPVTETLERAHAIGIVHRDIKPANIFLTTGAAPGARLLDFGLASMKSAAPLTEAGMVMGSPSYIAPETWRGNASALDGRADLFSLGVIVFRWLTGHLPFGGHDLIAKMLAVTSGPRPSAVALRPELPKSVDVWVARALAIEPKDRFQTGLELRDALAIALTGSAPARPKRAAAAKPRALVDAQQAFAAAFRSAGALLKRFTSKAPPAPAAEAPPEPAPPSRNTIWLDSTELEPVSSKRNTVWLDSNELMEAGVPVTPAAETKPKKASKPPPAPNRQSRPESEPPVASVAVKKAKVRVKVAAKAKPLKAAKPWVRARKRRKGPMRKSSR